MKKVILIVLSVILFIPALNSQTNQGKKDPMGTWKFEAPYAPEEYNSGTLTIGMAEKLYTATMSFKGSDYKLKGEKVKVEKDTITFIIYLENENINITIQIESDKKMAGKAVYSGGDVPFTLTK